MREHKLIKSHLNAYYFLVIDFVTNIKTTNKIYKLI